MASYILSYDIKNGKRSIFFESVDFFTVSHKNSIAAFLNATNTEVNIKNFLIQNQNFPENIVIFAIRLSKITILEMRIS